MQSIQAEGAVQRFNDFVNGNIPGMIYVNFSRLATGRTELYFQTLPILYEDRRISSSVELCNQALATLANGVGLSGVQRSLAELGRFMTAALNSGVISSSEDYLRALSRDFFQCFTVFNVIQATMPNRSLRDQLRITCSALFNSVSKLIKYLNIIHSWFVSIPIRFHIQYQLNNFAALTRHLMNIFYRRLYEPSRKIMGYLLQQSDFSCETNGAETTFRIMGDLISMPVMGDLIFMPVMPEIPILRLVTFPGPDSELVNVSYINMILARMHHVCRENQSLRLAVMSRQIVPFFAKRAEYERRAAQERTEPRETFAPTHDDDRV
jgi:hypothetical protein